MQCLPQKSVFFADNRLFEAVVSAKRISSLLPWESDLDPGTEWGPLLDPGPTYFDI